jgi:cell wall-associated NlpC family hydrolase
VLRALAFAASSLIAAVLIITGPDLITGPGPTRAYADPTTADLDRDVATAWQKLETVVERFNTTHEHLLSTQAQLADADARLAPLASEVDRLQEKVGTIAAGVYMSTGDGPVTALLGARSPGMLLDQLTLLDHIARGHRRDLDALRAATDRYQTQRRDLQALASEQATQDRELSVTKAVVESALAELQSLRTKAYGYGAPRATRSVNRDFYVPVFPEDPGGGALRFAFKQMGKNYRWAAAGPDAYDCSGLVLAAWRTAGRTLPHSAALQWNDVEHIQRDQLRPGDLVFYYRDIHHVAMYAGDGRIIEAPQAGEQVSIHPIDFAPVYGYGRVD